jgi:hypothetical protein
MSQAVSDAQWIASRQEHGCTLILVLFFRHCNFESTVDADVLVLVLYTGLMPVAAIAAP